MSRPPLPPLTDEAAAQKVRIAEDAWNMRDPVHVAIFNQSISKCTFRRHI
jgi:nuclear transport factor 2 (NTF2) superfamily protein